MKSSTKNQNVAAAHCCLADHPHLFQQVDAYFWALTPANSNRQRHEKNVGAKGVDKMASQGGIGQVMEEPEATQKDMTNDAKKVRNGFAPPVLAKRMRPST